MKRRQLNGEWALKALLDLTAKCVVREEAGGRNDLGDSNSHHEGRKAKGEDNAKTIKDSQPHLRQFGRVGSAAVRFLDPLMGDVEDPVQYEEALRSKENNKRKLALKEELDSIEKKVTRTQTILSSAMRQSPIKWYWSESQMIKDVLLATKLRLATKGFVQKDGVD